MSDLAKRTAQALQEGEAKALEEYHLCKYVYGYFANRMRLVEKALGDLWAELFEHIEADLIAIGGFGRGEIYPSSDLDLAILIPGSINPLAETTLALFNRILWDMGLKPSIIAGDMEELCQSCSDDLSRDTSFLEARLLFGSQARFDALMDNLGKARDIDKFVKAKILELKNRHGRTQGFENLEPNIKECPGGLRDIHTMMWIAKALGLEPSFQNLIKRKILNRQEASLLQKSHRFLATIRMELNLIPNHQGEVLLFDDQIAIAKSMGIVAETPGEYSEKLMRKVYRSIRTVKQLDEIILPMLESRVPGAKSLIKTRKVVHIDDNFLQSGDMLVAKNKDIFEKDSTNIYRLVGIFQKNMEIDYIEPGTLRAWWRASLRLRGEFRNNEENKRAFLEFFVNGDRLMAILQFLHLYGVLGKHIPEFARITGLLQHDLYHVYPVDVHSLMVLKNIRAMEKRGLNDPNSEIRSLARNFPKRHVLYLAAFFHDIGKGLGGKHEEKGAEIAAEFAREHHMDPEDAELLEWLVLNHLLFSLTAQKTDYHDPEVMTDFTNKMGDVKRLTALYLLTVADVKGTNPKLWTQWKENLFRDLYNEAVIVMQGGDKSAWSRLAQRRTEYFEKLASIMDSKEERETFLRNLGETYFSYYDQDEAEWHLEEIAKRNGEDFVAFRRHPDGTLGFMILLKNNAYLFAQICQIIAYHQFDILRAKAYITDEDRILDTFTVTLPENFNKYDFERKAEQMRLDLEDFVSGNFKRAIQPVKPPTSRRSRILPIVPKVVMTDEGDGEHWMVEIVGVNRTGLLANIAKAISDNGLSIRSAMIATLDERVEDSFLIIAPALASDVGRQVKLRDSLLDVLKN